MASKPFFRMNLKSNTSLRWLSILNVISLATESVRRFTSMNLSAEFRCFFWLLISMAVEVLTISLGCAGMQLVTAIKIKRVRLSELRERDIPTWYHVVGADEKFWWKVVASTSLKWMNFTLLFFLNSWWCSQNFKIFSYAYTCVYTHIYAFIRIVCYTQRISNVFGLQVLLVFENNAAHFWISLKFSG